MGEVIKGNSNRLYVWESLGLPWPTTQKRASHVYYGVLLIWSLGLKGSTSSPDEKSSLKLVCVCVRGGQILYCVTVLWDRWLVSLHFLGRGAWLGALGMIGPPEEKGPGIKASLKFRLPLSGKGL